MRLCVHVYTYVSIGSYIHIYVCKRKYLGTYMHGAGTCLHVMWGPRAHTT